MRVTLIHNPSAGGKVHSREALMNLLAAAGHSPRYRSTKDDWTPALLEPVDLVVAAGGDGTVSEVGAQMMGRRAPIAILPLGTANNIAAVLGLSRDLGAIVAGWSQASRVPFDVGLCEASGTRFSFLESVGAGTLAAAMAREQPKASDFESKAHMLEHMLRELRECIEECGPHRRKIVLDGEDRSGEHLMVEVLNIGTVGPAVGLSARADPRDGFLHVVLAGERDRAALCTHVHRSLSGAVDPPALQTIRARRIELGSVAGDVHVDGKRWCELAEEAREEDPVELSIWLEPGAIEFLVPIAPASPRLDAEHGP